MFNRFIINKTNLINNIKQVKLNNPNSLVCAMVKANAYGVGLKEVVKILSPYVDYYGVACFFEAKQVKKLCNNKVLIVGALEYGKIDASFSYTCHSLNDVKYLANKNLKINIHLKVNSGMNRFGFNSINEFKAALNLIKQSQLNLEGLFTHFATADDFVDTQMKAFLPFIKVCHEHNFYPIVHTDNSTVSVCKNHGLDMVRIGFDLYNETSTTFNSVVEMESKIVQINNVGAGKLVGYDYRFISKSPMKVAVVPVGYADGFDLHYIGLSLKEAGKSCKVLNICMDCFMLDVSKTNLKVGDKIGIINEENNLKKYAKYAKTSPYEVMTKFSNVRAKKIIKN